MKSLTFSCLLYLMITAFTLPTAQAQPTVINSATRANTSKSQLTPFNLVFLAYRGYLKQQDIPSYGGLKTAYTARRVSAKDIVKAGIAANRLSEEVLGNQRYINSVDLILTGWKK